MYQSRNMSLKLNVIRIEPGVLRAYNNKKTLTQVQGFLDRSEDDLGESRNRCE